MERDQATTAPGDRPRIAAIDAARGVALGGMVVYHLIWDFAHFGLIAPTAPFAPATRALSHVVASAFLALVGVSLALAHPHGLRRAAFLKRLALIVGAAALVTAASYAIDANEPILFGILHCIAVASLIAALFVAAPPWAALRRRRARRRRAVRRFERGVQSAGAGLARARNRFALHARLAAAAAVGGRRADRARAGAGRGAAALRLALDGVAADALARPRVRLRRPPQPRRSISSTSRSCSACCGAS